MSVWVDTDFGFDDLWAVLVLRAQGITIDGLSLVAGNAPLDQVMRNALGARMAFDADWPLYRGAASPLTRPQETAERILGPRGMQSRGHHLPTPPAQPIDPVEPAITHWLASAQASKTILALGPLTNLAHLSQHAPDSFARIDRIVWMGGASGRGNHSPYAEFNALADPEAAASVLSSGASVDVVDLEVCRSVSFGEDMQPAGLSPLLGDLLGGYLDIGLSRGRDQMAIYDPLAALALACPGSVQFTPAEVSVTLTKGARYGQTTFAPTAGGSISLASRAVPDAATRCLEALRKASQ